MKKFTLSILALILFSCSTDESSKSPAAYVDPFIGTAGHGHTYPGAAVPFGMVQLSPDTGTEGWDWCSGYHSSDSTIIGFSHTHLSGTGGADLGDILFMPANGNILFDPGTKEEFEDGYRSRFDHKDEFAEAGYYSVLLKDYNTKVELTATPRTGQHKYTFNGTDPQHVIIDLTHGIADMTTGGYYHVIDSITVAGYRRSKGWADDHTVYFYAKFSKPFTNFEAMVENTPNPEKEGQGTDVCLALLYEKPIAELEIQVGISMVSIENADANLRAEHCTFDQARAAAYESWNTELSKIKVEGGKDIDKTIFYTALYHTMLAPTLISDTNGDYPGKKNIDKEVLIAKIPGATDHKSNGEKVYGLFSLWDTFRAVHPLFTIIDPARNENFIRSMLLIYDQTGRLPVWDLNFVETNCMIGYHAIPVIADAYMKGYRNFDTEKALEAMVAGAMQQRWNGVNYLRELGYIPSEKEENSVSKALEITYDDWCIAQMAKAMGKDSIYNVFIERAQYYKNHFDPTDGFFKGRSSTGVLNPDFNPVRLSLWGSGDFTEGNAWHYNFFVPQDINTHIEMNGGDSAYIARIDEMFATEGVEGEVSDVSGLIGQYAHGNEPSHHVAYLYSYAGKPWKTQQAVAHIINSMYTAQRDGICGNEDCGQMSAWYVMSAMGFYEVTPASGIYVLGTPKFKQTTINLPNGKKFVIEANGIAEKNIYIKSVKYNGKPYEKSYITHEMIASGGKLTMTMSEEPNPDFGLKPENRPVSKITDRVTDSEKMLSKVVFEPELSEPRRVFNGSITLNPTANQPIYYTTNGTEPTIRSNKVGDKGITLKDNTLLKMAAISDEGKSSGVTTNQFYVTHMPESAKITASTPDKPYMANGSQSLNDGLLGGNSYRNPAWLGYNGSSPEFVIELPSAQVIRKIGINTINKPNDWIVAPVAIKIRLSQFGKPIAELKIKDRETLPEGVKLFEVPMNIKARKIYITLEGGVLPSWHIYQGKKSWIFVDEIILN